jgi:hypothetical protein
MNGTRHRRYTEGLPPTGTFALRDVLHITAEGGRPSSDRQAIERTGHGSPDMWPVDRTGGTVRPAGPHGQRYAAARWSAGTSTTGTFEQCVR